jgi:hypothetical protein
MKTSTTLHPNRRDRDDTNVTNDDVFRSVCSAYLRPIFVVCADMTHSPWENPRRLPMKKNLKNPFFIKIWFDGNQTISKHSPWNFFCFLIQADFKNLCRGLTFHFAFRRHEILQLPYTYYPNNIYYWNKTVQVENQLCKHKQALATRFTLG